MNSDVDNIKALIDFDNPDEDLVMRAIFWEAKSGEHRGFTDAFTSEEIQRMAASPTIDEWLEQHRDWIRHTVAGL
jgi:hypothetical protein